MADYQSQFTGQQIDQRLAAVTDKQDRLVSGTNIKTVGGQSILGSGDIPIQAGDPNAVKYVAQTLTDAQKTQARTNIGAAAASALSALETAIAAKYSKPSGGIPETDLASAVQSALALARTSIQSLADYYSKTEVDALLDAVGSEQYVDVTTLPTASASTLGKIYLVGPDANGFYDRYYTSYDGSTYSWVAAGNTEINLANYATKAEISQLQQEVTADISQLEAEVTDLDGYVDDITDKVQTSNLLDVSKVTDNKYWWGGASDASGLCYTDKMPVTPGKTYTFQWTGDDTVRAVRSMRMIYGYKSDNTPATNGSAQDATSYTAPDDCAYVIMTFYMNVKGKDVAFVESATVIPYESYGFNVVLKEDIVAEENLADASVSTDKMVDDSVTIGKINFKTTVVGKNLFDKSLVVPGYISSNGNIDSSVTTLCTSDFIPVVGGEKYCFSDGNTNEIRCVLYFDGNKDAISASFETYVNSVTTAPSNAHYIRITVYTARVDASQLEHGDTPTAYTPYSQKTVLSPEVIPGIDSEHIEDGAVTSSKIAPGTTFPSVLPALSLCGKDCVKVSADNIVAGGTMQISDFPQYLKANGVVSFSGKLTSFNLIKVGFGNSGGAIQAVVDGTNLYIHKINASSPDPAVYRTYAHGLTISDFIDITFDNDFFNPKVVVATKSGIFVQEMGEFPSIESYGLPCVILGQNTVVTNAELRATSDKFSNPIWVVGDSYTSLYAERWTYQMAKTIGIDNFLIIGLAGGGSAQMYSELEKALNFGTPKFLLWCLGMNDSFATWSQYSEMVKTLCESMGAELILQTIPIPNLPTSQNQEDINEAIRESGYRFIDACAAMCPNDTYPWYSGFTDEETSVHPNVLGAKVLAARFLSDFPEFLQ